MSESKPRFLVIRLSSIGDIVHALPAVAALGDAFPGAEIHWLVEKRHADLLKGNPYVHRVIKLDTLGWRHELISPWTLEQIAGAGMALREERFDAAIDFQGLVKTAFLASISKSARRIGFSEYWLREPLAGIFYTDRVSPHGRGHVIEMNLSLVEHLGVPRLPSAEWEFPLPKSDADDSYVERQLATLGARDFVILNPGGGWKSKCWAPENFSELIQRLEREIPEFMLLTGSPQEETLIDGILRRAGSSRAAYFPSTILQLIALIRRARLFVGGDTGPLHLAEAAGVPVVAIFSASEPVNTPERNGPFRPDDIFVTNRNGTKNPAREKNHDFLRDVPVASVFDAVRGRLASVGRRMAARSHG
ncbi:MAG TPA: lipopolysaccharide heptosyltransferase I [Terriglobia bacterium]|nr:lipopolysaccharide heptosyltransferase I [Terriglobia bacterium]